MSSKPFSDNMTVLYSYAENRDWLNDTNVSLSIALGNEPVFGADENEPYINFDDPKFFGNYSTDAEQPVWSLCAPANIGSGQIFSGVNDSYRSSLSNISTSTPITLLTYSGSGFDATRVFSPAVVKVGGEYVMLYGALPFANNEQIGLATSTDGVNWTKSASNPVISNANSQSWASFREIPVTLMYVKGKYELWFNGDNSNLSTDAGYGTGFGFATSTDGINWTWNSSDPIRWTLNSPLGTTINLDDVVRFKGEYVAYYTKTTATTSTVEEITSSDGITFGSDTAVVAPSGYSLLAATTRSVDGCAEIDSVWQNGTTDYYGRSLDGKHFTIEDTISIPTGFGINDIAIKGGTITFYGTEDEGNINWNFGNTDIDSITATLCHRGR